MQTTKENLRKRLLNQELKQEIKINNSELNTSEMNMNKIKNVTLYNNNFTAETSNKRECSGTIRILFNGNRRESRPNVTMVVALGRLVRLVNAKSQEINSNINYSVLFNDWVNVYDIWKKSKSTSCSSHYDSRGRRRIQERTQYELLFMDGMLMIDVVLSSYTTKDFGIMCFKEIVKGLIEIPSNQMEETQQGEATQDSDKANNTIVTRDASQTVEIEKGISLLSLENICSTEPVHTFDSIANRWMALPSIEVTTSDQFNSVLRVYNLPSFLYSENSAPNMMPFQNFLFGKYDVIFKFVVNANKFHVGKIVASVKYDSYQIDALYNDVTTMLSRPHVIMDLAANNEAILGVPFKYHRTFVRNASLANSQYGSKAAQYASISVSVLSPLGAIAGAPTSMFIRPFYTIRKGTFTGMSYKIPLAQMEDIARGVRVLENALHFVGQIPNMDKPYDSNRVSQVILRPRLNFQSGKGASDCVPMRIDPLAQTTFLKDHHYPEDPVNVLQIARIWGFALGFDWKAESEEGAELFSMPIEPTWRQRSEWDGVPTPLEYVSSMYQFWSGPLEVRLDFVSNSFHTGSVMISAEFGRVSESVEQSSSTYTKIFHLGEQKSVTFTIPYIYDTVWRRTSSTPWCPLLTSIDANQKSGQVAVLRANSSALKVRVINKLVPVQSVVQDIKVLMFIRGGENFTLHSPIMANLLNSHAAYQLVNFPGEFSDEPSNETSRYSLARNLREVGAIQISHKWMQGQTPKDIKNKSLVNKQKRFNSTTKFGPNHNTLQPEPPIINYPFLKGLPPALSSEPYRWMNKVRATLRWVPNIRPPPGYIYFFGPTLHKNGTEDKQKWTWDNKHLIQYGYEEAAHALVIRVKDDKNQLNTFYVKLDNIESGVEAQMDQGDEEDMDPTQDFNQGCDRNNVQTIESHLNIKDLLRRPVCIISNHAVAASSGEENSTIFCVPCMPPSHMMAYGESENRIFAPFLGRSMSTHLLDMFRFWRGSQRYTVITSRTNGAPIYATYFPHSGSMIVGEVSFVNSELLSSQISPACFGLATEVMIPSLNPTMAIEAPYETEDNWTLMACENWERNFSWRDKGDYNCGHIVLWSAESFNVDIFWSAGDDFTISNFLGPPSCKAPFSKFFYSDNHPEAQMEDFRSTETKNTVSSFFKNLIFPASMAAVSQIPMVGTPVATAIIGAKLSNKVDHVVAQVDEVTTKSLSVLNSMDELLEYVKVKLSGIFDTSSTLFTATFNSLIDVLMNVGKWDAKIIGLAILRFITNIASYPIAKLMEYLPNLISLFKTNPVAQDMTSQEQISGAFWSDDKIKDAFKVFVGIFAMMAGGIKCNFVDWSPVSLLKSIARAPFDYRNVALANQMMIFISTIFTIIKDAVLWVISRLSPEAKIVSMLRSESEEINQFVNESQILMNEANRSCYTSPEFRLRYWVNVVKAYEIQRRLVGLPNGSVSHTLSRMCSDVIKQGKENMADLKCSPIKYEPFVVCIEGAAGIGKSMLVRTLATKMLHKIGITTFSGDPIYYRISGSRHWNGYGEQPVVIYDDWMNVLEPNIVAQVLNELYQLKSCATFVPEQAAIEEKKIKATPRIVILLCNRAFPDAVLTNMVGCKDAVYRRRDILVKASLKEEYKNRNLRTLTNAEGASMSHLLFEEFANVCDSESRDGILREYPEFLEIVLNRLVEYDTQELNNVKNRMDDLLTFFSSTRISLRDPFSVFYSGIQTVTEGNSVFPSEALEEQVRMIAMGLDRVEENIGNVVDNNVEAQISFQAISVCLLAASALVPVSITTFNSFVNYLASKQQMSVGTTAQCCVCKETTQVHYVCSHSWRTVRSQSLDSLHLYCAPCYQRMCSRPFACAMCRVSDAPYRIIARECYESSLLVARIYRASNYSRKVLARTMEYLKGKYGYEIWTGFAMTIASLSSVVTRLAEAGDCATPSMILCNYGSAALSLVSIYYTSKAINIPTHEVHVSVDPTANRWVPKIEAFDNESLQLLQQINTFNNSYEKGEQEYLDLMRRYRDTFRRRTGNLDLYCEIVTGVFICDVVVDLNRKIEDFNLKVMKNIASLNVEMIKLEKAEIDSQRVSVMPFPEEQMLGPPYRIRHFQNERLPDMRNVYNYVFDETKVDFGSVFNTVCPHEMFRDGIEHVRYEDGVYVLTTMQGTVPFPKACENHNTCPLLDEEERVQCAKKFFDLNKNSWLSWILTLEENHQVREIKKYLPEYAWPSWINMNPIVLDEPLFQDNWYSRLKVPPILKNILTGVAVGVSTLVIIKAASSIMNVLFPAAQIVPSGDAVIRHFRPKLQRVVRPNVRAQSETQDAICDKINANYFVIIVHLDGKDIRLLNGVGIKQRLGLIPRHYFTYLQDQASRPGIKLYLAKPHNLVHRVEIAFDATDFTYSETADICVYQLPQSANMFKDITKYMATDEDMVKKMANTGLIITPPLRNGSITKVIPIEIKKYIKSRFIMSESGNYESEHCLSYSYSKKGACGSLVLKDFSQRPIVAMHIAGQGDDITGTGYGVILTKEMFEDFKCEISGLAKEYEVCEQLEDCDELRMHLPVDSVVEYEGKLPKDLVAYSPHKSKIRPSLIQNCLPWEPIKQPAILSSYDPRYKHDISPLIAGAAKHGYLTRNFTHTQLDKIANLRFQQLLMMKPHIIPTTRLTINEAIVGFDGLEYYDPLHLDTSAGWPYCTQQKTLKKDYCQIDRNEEGRVLNVEVSSMVVDRVERTTNNRRKGIVPFTIFLDTLKDEKRKPEKLLALGGTRVFCASPFDFSICMRQNFLHFVASYMKNRWNLNHAVGINLQGPECTTLVSRLLEIGNNIVTIDYSNFGPGFNAGVARIGANNIKNWTLNNVENVNEVELDCLLEENLNSLHGLNHLVYRQMGGSPSGSPITVIINSEVNILYIMIVWDILINVDEKWREFTENVCMFVYGDDLIMSVSDKYISLFNALTITQLLKQYNIIATDASKQTDLVPYTGIDQATFLKCNFAPHPTRLGHWIAQLAKDSVLDTPMWIKEEISFKEATRINGEAAIRAAYGYGKGYFDDMLSKINTALSYKKIDPILLDWYELDEKFYGMDS